MTHVSFVGRNEPPVEIESDYVVIGSGAGGASAAVTLARGGASVTVVEAGAWLEPKDYPSSMYGSMRDLFDEWGTTVTRGRAIWPVVQASAVGGTTVINSAICVRTPEDVFDRWQREWGVGGGELARRVGEYQDQIERELFAAKVPEPSRGRSNELAMSGASALGYDSRFMTRYVRDCEGAGQCLQGCRRERKQSLNLNYLPELLERGGSVVSCAPVERIELEGGRAVGAVGRFRHPQSRRPGASFRVRARRAVVLAASATHSPALLQRSGFRSQAVGAGFTSHPGTGVFGVYDDIVDMNLGATQGWASIAFRESPGFKLETLSLPPEMVASRLAGGGPTLMKRLAEYRHFAFWVLAARTETRGHVKNGWGNRPVVRFSLDAADMDRVRKGLHLIARTHFAAGAKKVIPNIYGFPYSLGPDEVDALLEAPLDPRRYTLILSHLFGGCIMGDDESRAVCDERGRVYGVNGLVVADASIMPTNIGVNPQHTIMALAHCRAEELLNEERLSATPVARASGA